MTQSNKPFAFFFDGADVTAIKYRDGEFHTDLSGLYRPTYGGYREWGLSDDSYARAYMACVWLFRAINVRVSKVADVLRRGQLVERASGKPVDEHPYLHALELAYQLYAQDVYEDWIFSKAVFGEAYIEKVNQPVVAGFGIPRTMRVLNALAAEPLIERGAVRGYQYRDDGGTVTFAPDEIVFDKAKNPLDDTRGFSLVAAAMDAVNIDRSIILLTRSHLKNNARPGLIFTPKEGRLSQADVDIIQSTLSEDAKGPQNAGNPLLMPTAFDVTVAAPPPLTDIDATSEAQKRRICSVVGVPAALVDYVDMAFQLSPEQNRTFYELTLIPEASKVARVVNAQLLPFFDARRVVELRLPLDEIRAELGDPTQRTTVYSQQLNAGALSLNEYRALLGHKPLPGGDVHFIPMGAQIVQADALGTVSAMPAPPIPFMAVDVPEDAAKADATTDAVPPGKTIRVALDFSGNADLIGLQTRMKELLGSSDVTWMPADQFALTLLEAPAATDAQIQALQTALEDTPLPTLRIGVGSLRGADNLGNHALHLKARRNAALLDLQEEIYELCADAAINALSPYAPGVFEPRFLMGYVKGRPVPVPFRGTVTVEPSALVLLVDGQAAWRSSAADIEAPELPKHEDALEELDAWERKAVKHGTTKAAGFVAYRLDEAVAARIRAKLAALGGTKDTASIKAVFASEKAVLKKKPLTAGATPEEYLAYWGDYDALMDDIGAEWLTGYMRETFSILSDKPSAADIEKALETRVAALVEAWIGTLDAPGPLARVMLAGMGAGQAALERDRSIDPQKPIKAITLKVDWSLLSKEALEFVRAYAFDLIRGINQTTVQQVQAALDEWMQSGEPLSGLSERLERVFNNPVRAALIAQTETTRAYNRGAERRWEEAGVARALWQTVRDALVCPVCGALHGVIGTLNDGWKSSKGMIKPPAHPGCRCFARPVLDEPVENADDVVAELEKRVARSRG